MTTTVSRRALLAAAGTAVASGALSVPYVNAAHTYGSETITDRLDRLTSELAEAMSEYQGGKYTAIVEPAGDVSFVAIDRSPEDRLRHATTEIRAAMGDLGSTDYWVMIKPEGMAKAFDWAPDGSGAARREIALA